MKVFYFGCCRGESGHYWHLSPDMSWKREISLDPLGIVDAKYPPRVGPDRRTRPDLMDYRAEAPQGQAALIHEKGWTLIAYWDRSQDERGNSNSAFAAEGDYTFEDLLTAAKEQWPWVFERQAFEVKPFVDLGNPEDS